MKNKLLIAGAGTGKTNFIIESVLKLKKDKIIITTFTDNCSNEIRDKIIKNVGYIPSNIVIKPWFTLLIHDFLEPYKCYYEIGKISGIELESGSHIKLINGQVFYNKKIKTENDKIYSSVLSKIIVEINERSKGKIISRLEEEYSYIFIDEVQDLCGYDLEIIKLILNSKIKLIMVGDPRQAIYSTHKESKNSKYNSGIDQYIQDNCKDLCEIDCETLNICYRCDKNIVELANAFIGNDYPNLMSDPKHEIKEHQGVFYIKSNQIEEYVKKYEPKELYINKRILTKTSKYGKVENKYTFGQSKGDTYDRVLVYPTNDLINYLKKNKAISIGQGKNKIYVALTRAITSLTFVLDTSNCFNLKNGLENNEKN